MNEQEIIKEAVKESLERGKEIFREKDDCTEQMNEVKGKVGGVESDVSAIKTTVGVMSKALWAIFVALLGSIVATLWGIILRYGA